MMVPLGVSENHLMVELILTFWQICAKVTLQSPHLSLSLETSYVEESRLCFSSKVIMFLFSSDIMAKHSTEKTPRYTLEKEKKEDLISNRSQQAKSNFAGNHI